MKKNKTLPIFSATFYNNEKNRAILYQVFALLLIISFTYFVFDNMFENIQKRGIKTGFDFLNDKAGFGIIQTLINYSEDSSFGAVFLIGFLNTILVSIITIILASIIGVLVGVGRLSSNWMVSKISMLYVEIFRNIPVLLQILFWYNVVLASLPSPRRSVSFFDSIYLNNRGFILPKPLFESGFIWVAIAFILAIIAVIYLSIWAKKRYNETGKEFALIRISLFILVVFPLLIYFLSGSPISLEHTVLKGFNFEGGVTIIPELLALSFALSIYAATYISEAIRAGIESVSKGQKEAAISLGLKKSVILKKIIFPQALRVIIPPVINQYATLVKNSSLATAIAYPEIMTIFSGTALNQVGQAIEIMLITMTVYLSLNIIISLLMNYFNFKMQIKKK